LTGPEQPPSATHDSETAAARYLGGDLRPRAARVFEQHLLACEPCWQDVEAGRAGRRIAESARQVAPAELRERLRAVVASQHGADPVLAAEGAHVTLWSVPVGFDNLVVRRFAPPRLSRSTVKVVALSLSAALAVLMLVLEIGPWAARPPAVTRQPEAVAAAVADFRALRLPGARVPETAAPDLTGVQLRSIGAAAGQVGGRPVTAYSYRDAAGRTVLVYLSRDPFPTAIGAQRLTGVDGPWIAAIDGVTVLCARSPHALLVLGRDRQLVLGVARALNVT
jgi:hypothetical protein